MRKLTFLGLAILVAACAPVQQKPAPKPVAQPQRFDGLQLLAQESPPERDAIRESFRYARSSRATSIDGLNYYFYEPGNKRSVIGFSVRNDGSPTINPVGLRHKGARREYAFHFADRARENIYLAINDDVKITGRFSHDNMFRELHFFPRKQLPSLRVDHSKGLLEVTLPTGEPVLFDEDSMELVGGALKESPIDFNRSRHLRHNPEVNYKGDYLVVTVAQRGEAPRRAQVWGQTKYAEVYYPSKYKKPCRLSPKYIWDQHPKKGDNDPKLTMLHKSDAELFATVEQQCGWDLAQLKGAASQVAEAAN